MASSLHMRHSSQHAPPFLCLHLSLIQRVRLERLLFNTMACLSVHSSMIQYEKSGALRVPATSVLRYRRGRGHREPKNRVRLGRDV